MPRKNLETKVIALDVYGTMLATNDLDNELPARKGLANFLKRCKRLGIILCTCSDSYIETAKLELEIAKVDLAYFNEFFQMQSGAGKNFSPILQHYQIEPEELLVIGDRLYQDIEPALKLGCKTAEVDEYVDERSDKDVFRRIKIE